MNPSKDYPTFFLTPLPTYRPHHLIPYLYFMLTFFRRIRNGLLGEGAATRYLLYALGEILLVMIGILLALQVNNWNEERKEMKQGQEYVLEIYDDLQNEVQKLEIAIDLLKTQEQSSKYLLSIMESENKIVQDSMQFIWNEIQIVKLVEINRNRNTWDELSEQGKMNLIFNDSLRHHLQSLYSKHDYHAKNFNEVPRNARMKARSIGADCFDLKSTERFHYNDFKNPPTSRWFSCWMNNNETVGAIRSVLITCFWNIPWFTEVKEEAQSIITYMEENYADILSQE